MFERNALSVAVGVVLVGGLSMDVNADCASSGSSYHFCLEAGEMNLTSPDGQYSGKDYGVLGPSANNLTTVEVNSNADFTDIGSTGIRVIADDLVIRNYGDISFTGGNAIRGSAVNTSTIVNEGLLSDIGQDGIEGAADYVSITNVGSIDGVSGNAIGVVAWVEAVVINAGNISDSGYNGIEIHGPDVSITNDGVIGNVPIHGIEVFMGGDASVINNGNIVAGASGVEFDRQSGDVYLKNNGSISGTGAGVNVMLAATGSLSIINSGDIIGLSDYGIKVGGGSAANASILNAGVISAKNDLGRAVDFSGTSTSFSFINDGGSVSGGVLGSVSSGDSLNFYGGQMSGLIEGVESVGFYGSVYLSGVDIIGRDTYGVSVNNAGRLILEGSMNIDGNYVQADNSVMEILLNDDISLSTPIVDVQGLVTFGVNTQIELSPQVDGYSPSAVTRTYSLLQATEIVGGENVEIFSDSVLIDVQSFSVDSRVINAIVSANDAGDVIQQGGYPVSSAVIATASAAQHAILANPSVGEFDPVRLAFESAAESGVEEFTEFVETLTPDVSGQVVVGAGAFASSAVSGVSGRVNAMNKGMASGDLFSQSGLWVKGFSSRSDQDARDYIRGFSADVDGVSVGVDGRIDNESLLGFAFSYGNTDVDADGSKNSTEIDSYLLSLYGSRQLGDYSVDGVIGYGINDNTAKRYVAGTELKADYDGDLLFARAQISRGVIATESWLVKSKILLAYSRLGVDGYQEEGSTAALLVGGQRYEDISIGAGIELTYSTDFGGGVLMPELEIIAMHDFAEDAIQSTNRFVSGGPNFIAVGSDVESNSYILGVKLNYFVQDYLSFNLGYEIQAEEDYKTEAISATVRYDF